MHTMVKKLKQMADKKNASSGRLFDGVLAGSVKDSAQQIWLAGLGAFARAQAEGTKVFETLVKDGTTLQKKTQSAAEEKIGEVASKVTSMAGDVQAKAGQHWDKLEGIFEERTAKAMKKLGVPSAKDVDALVARIDELSAKIAAMSKAAPAKTTAAKSAAKPAAKTPAKKKAEAKAPAKRASARKSVA
jgi:poly(hydroxyalkanoate) granule-associated protein